MSNPFNPSSFMSGMGSLDAGGGFLSGIGGGTNAALMSAGGSAATGIGGGLAGGAMMGAAAGPIGMVAGMVLSGVAASAQARAQKKADQRKELGSLYAGAYDKALNEWYARKGMLEKRKALENYNQFNKMEQIAPGYKDIYQPAALEAIPDARYYVAGNNKKTKASNYAYQKKEAQAGQGTVTVPGG